MEWALALPVPGEGDFDPIRCLCHLDVNCDPVSYLGENGTPTDAGGFDHAIVKLAVQAARPWAPTRHWLHSKGMRAVVQTVLFLARSSPTINNAKERATCAVTCARHLVPDPRDAPSRGNAGHAAGIGCK